MNEKPEILKPGGKFVMTEDAKGNPQTLFYIHDWSQDGYRWNKDDSEWTQVEFEVAARVLKNLYFGEFEYESLNKETAERLFPGSTDVLPQLNED
jgi:hypothetical protein